MTEYQGIKAPTNLVIKFNPTLCIDGREVSGESPHRTCEVKLRSIVNGPLAWFKGHLRNNYRRRRRKRERERERERSEYPLATVLSCVHTGYIVHVHALRSIGQALAHIMSSMFMCHRLNTQQRVHRIRK